MAVTNPKSKRKSNLTTEEAIAVDESVKTYDLWANIGFRHNGQFISIGGVCLDNQVEYNEALCTQLGIKNGMKAAKLAATAQLRDTIRSIKGRRYITMEVELYHRDSDEQSNDDFDFDIKFID